MNTLYKRSTWILVRSGTQGMKWGHRYHQDYITKPTRSGMVGEVHFNKDVDHDKRLTNSEQNKREKKQDNYKEKAMELYDKLDSINADLSELDMFDEASQKKIISDYKRMMNQYKKLTGEVPREYVRDINKLKETRGIKW